MNKHSRVQNRIGKRSHWRQSPAEGEFPIGMLPGQRQTSRNRLCLLPIIAIGATWVYSSWHSTAGRAYNWTSIWQLRRHNTLHQLRPDQGLLVVNNEKEHALHPIVDLIRLGEQVWNDKLASQSRTLQETYVEYIRRYSACALSGAVK